MRIAYIAPYNGPTLRDRRPVIRNLSLSNTIKVELIARLIKASSHQVEVISPGQIMGSHFRFYPSFNETDLFDADIPVTYASTIPLRFVNGFWSSWQTIRLFAARHRASPFDLVMIFNLHRPNIACANYAMRQHGLPIVLEYEDDSFVDVTGMPSDTLLEKIHQQSFTRLLRRVSGAIGVSPHLLAQCPEHVPKRLLRGVVGDDIAAASAAFPEKKNWVLVAGTLTRDVGIRQVIEAWELAKLEDWELHITGHGEFAEELKGLVAAKEGVFFHGLVSRQQLVYLLSSAKICINPYLVSQRPGNIFAFKVIEYLAAGAHCITTPMGKAEPEIDAGLTYIQDIAPETIAATLRRVISERRYELQASQAILRMYGSAAVSESLNTLFQEVMAYHADRKHT